MTDFTPEFIASLLELAEKATPRPWECKVDWLRRHVDEVYVWAETPVIKGKEQEDWNDIAPRAEADRAFMEAFMNIATDALQEIQRLQKENAEMKAYLKSIHMLDKWELK